VRFWESGTDEIHIGRLGSYRSIALAVLLLVRIRYAAFNVPELNHACIAVNVVAAQRNAANLRRHVEVVGTSDNDRVHANGHLLARCDSGPVAANVFFEKFARFLQGHLETFHSFLIIIASDVADCVSTHVGLARPSRVTRDSIQQHHGLKNERQVNPVPCRYTALRVWDR